MDRALPSPTAAGVRNQTRPKIFKFVKIISSCILEGTQALCSLSLSQWLGLTLETGDLLWERKNCGKNPSRSIGEENEDIRELYGRKGVKKSFN